MMEPSVDVITVTRHRPHLLPRAIASVARQDYSGPVKHSVLVNDCVPTHRWCQGASLPDGVSWSYESGLAEPDGPARIAALRNRAVARSTADFVAFLDDDNAMHPGHLRTLVETADQAACDAVHSWRRLLNPDGSPHLQQCWPWERSAARAPGVWKRLESTGVVCSGSEVLMDSVEGWDSPTALVTVDTNEWLMRRELALDFAFPTHISAADWDVVAGEDHKMVLAMLRAGVQIACSRRATVDYYLGGFSNSDSGPFIWSRPETTG